ncbi:MAG: hypothetical protein AB1705_14210 [Verrucomicrobiota bacterium]
MLARFALILWMAMMLVVVGLAVLFVHRTRVAGIVWAVVAVLGGMLCYGFVSAAIGVYEIQDYAQKAAFWVSVLAGCKGVALLVIGLRRLRMVNAS